MRRRDKPLLQLKAIIEKHIEIGVDHGQDHHHREVETMTVIEQAIIIVIVIIEILLSDAKVRLLLMENGAIRPTKIRL